ncbi:LytR/AlgR family response regulator transcription factor [Emergencia sp.]|uniref:LytR/AlgR family response regulator transcription factor n=1 Tax=Emergencia sp. TaxID=1926557 RepID=UPI003AF04500
MIKICICDDNIEDLEYTFDLVKEFAESHSEYAIKLRKFQSAYDLLDCIEADCSFDIFILDIVLPHINGIELAKKIRQRKEPCEIIFASTSREFAVDAFEVNATNYIVKPIAKEDFDRILEETMRKIQLNNRRTLIIKVKGGMRKIATSDIIVIESFSRRRGISLLSGEQIETGSTLASLFELLDDYDQFFMPHRAYIVNLEHISSIMGSDILMCDGQRIPISRNCGKGLKDAYLKFLFQ